MSDLNKRCADCKHYPAHRILSAECLGMSCPDCKIHGHAEFISHLKGAEE